MRRSTRVLALTVVVLMAGTWVLRAEKPESKTKGTLPVNWSKLGLTDDQKQKVHTIRGGYKDKIEDLQKQISDLKKKEKADLEAVLTDAQRQRLREILTEKGPTETKKPEKTPEPKPAPEAPKEVKKPETKP